MQYYQSYRNIENANLSNFITTIDVTQWIYCIEEWGNLKDQNLDKNYKKDSTRI